MNLIDSKLDGEMSPPRKPLSQKRLDLFAPSKKLRQNKYTPDHQLESRGSMTTSFLLILNLNKVRQDPNMDLKKPGPTDLASIYSRCLSQLM